MAKVRLAPEAQRDFDAIIDYLTRMAGARVAGRYVDLIVAALDRLANFPSSGTPRPELGELTKFVVVHPYLIFYDAERDGGEVRVLRLLHGARQITSEMIGLGRR